MSQDLYLHIAVGRWILEHHEVPRHGILSGSMPDAPWLAHEWLSSLGIAALYDGLGWNGVLAAAGLALACAIAIVAYEFSRTGGPAAGLTCAVLAWGLCLGHMQARPHLVTLPFFALWIAAHVRARRREGVPPYALALVMAVWANLHGGFLIGPAFTLLFAAEAVYDSTGLEQAAVAARRWGFFFGLAMLGTLITPHGVDGVLFPIRLTAMTTALNGITEWQPSSLENNPPLIIWLLLVLMVTLFFGFRAAVTRIAMVLLLIYLAFAHFRYTELLALAAPLLAEEALAGTPFARIGTERLAWHAAVGRTPLLAAAALLGTSAALVFAFAVRNTNHDRDQFTPEAAVDWALAHKLGGPVMNTYNFGGYLIFRGLAPFIDGRVELYGQDFVAKDFALDQFPTLLDRYNAAWTIFEPQNPRNVILEEMPGWQQVYSDGQAVIYVRKR